MRGGSKENGLFTGTRQDKKYDSTRYKTRRGDRKWESNDSPEIPDRERHQTSQKKRPFRAEREKTKFPLQAEDLFPLGLRECRVFFAVDGDRSKVPSCGWIQRS